MPDSEKGHAEHSEKSLKGDGYSGLLAECFFIGVLLMKAIITLHPTKYILASCPVKKVPFDQVPITACKFCNRVQFSSGYLLTQTGIQS